MKDENNGFELKVGELTQREEFGRGIIRLGSNVMQDMGIQEGDIVELEGERKTTAIAIRPYPSDAGLNIARIDGLVRRNASVGVGDNLKIRKADAKEAKKVILAPAQKGMFIQISPNLIKQNIFYRPVTKGDIIVPSPVVKRRNDMDSIFQAFGFDIEDMLFTPTGETRFVVTSTNPDGIVRITDMTELEILKTLPKGFDLEKRTVPSVTYEDIGGIHQAIHKVREMIELPLRHPELFTRLGIEPPKGVLLHGPPGTGKTLLARAVANESGANFYSIAGPEIMCVGGETKIFTKKGLLTSEEIYKTAKAGGEIVDKNQERETIKIDGIDVFSLNPEMKIERDKITEVTKLRAPVYKITTDDGSVIRVSENQPFATLDNNGNIKWQKSAELLQGMHVGTAQKISINSQENLEWADKLDREYTYVQIGDKEMKLREAFEKYGEDLPKRVKSIKFSLTKSNLSRANQIKPVTKLNDELMRFLGSMFAEGHINTRGDVCFANTNPEFKMQIANYIKNQFGVNGTLTKITEDKVTVYSKTLANYLNNVCGLPVGKKHQMHLPQFIFNASEENISSFISGYFDGDGTVGYGINNFPTPRLYSVDKCFLEELQLLMQTRLSITSKVGLWKTKLGNLFALTITGNDGRALFERKILSKSLKRKDWKLSGKRIGEDFLPNAICSILKKAKEKLGVKYGKDIPESSIEPYISGRKKMTRRKLKQIVSMLSEFGKIEELNQLEKVSQSDIKWSKIISIKKEGEDYLYDFGVEKNSNFIGGVPGMLLLHNSKWYGQSEENLRKIFEEAEKNGPSIIFIDEIDAIAPKREDVTGEVERRVVSQLLTMMDGLKARGKVIVIAATNRVNSIDVALRRPGRFDREIEIGIPDKKGRKECLEIHSRQMPLAKDVNLDKLAEITYGYTGADISALIKEAAMHALRRLLPKIQWKDEGELPKESLEKLIVNKNDFEEALKLVEPSAMREILIEIPNVKWEDIGGLNYVKEQLKESVEWPLKNPESFKNLGIVPPNGILLYGPPGCGKTLLAKAVATESQANFISVKGPELTSKWYGESEKKVRELFRRAKQVSPSIIFFDEIDALVPIRGMRRGDDVTERIVSQMLTELSGLEDLHDVVVIAATNRPDMLDTALLRPGRFDRQILVPEPDKKTRLKILEAKTQNMPLAKDVNLKKIADQTDGFSGADLESLSREAGMNSLRKDKKTKEIKMKDFESAFNEIRPSLNEKIIEFYNQFNERSRKKIIEEKNEMRYVG